jgi:hypothetical protein
MIYLFYNVYSQNRITNGSFESGNYDDQASGYENYIDNLYYWEHDAYIPSEPGVETWHSPDWFDEYGHQGSAYDGTKFVGVYEFEVIEQELTGSNKLEPGKFYLFSCFVQLFFEYDNYNDLNQYEDYDLKFYLSKNKINYKSHLIDDFCSSDYKKVTNNKIKTIKKFDLDPFPNEEWFELKFLYVAPNDIGGINDYNWFGIELITDQSTSCKGAYILFDDISIIEVDYCSFESCVRTTGNQIASNPFSYHSPYGPIAVDFLENIETASNIAIYDIYGKIRDIQDVHSVNGIYNPIFWDGKNSGGTQVAPGSYIWKMDLTNNCGTFSYQELFTKVYTISDPIPIFPNYSNVRTPFPCCSDEEDITIDYDVTGSGKIEFIAVNNITLQNMSIESSVDDLYLQAGNKIVFKPGVSIESGAKVMAKIHPCFNDEFLEEGGQLKSETLKNNWTNNSIGKKLDEDIINANLGEIDLVIYPNPTAGEFIVKLKYIPENLKLYITIYDINAKIVLQKNNVREYTEIDLSESPPGIYSLILIAGDMKSRWQILRQ